MRLGCLLTTMILVSIASAAEADQSDKRLDPLFAELKSAGSEDKARPVEKLIWEIWSQTDDPTDADSLERGTLAMAQHQFGKAQAAFDGLVAHAPGFAEGWNKRATLYYLMGRYDLSIADIRHTLALEPRHFGALSGLGLIMLALERPEVALKSFEAALEVHPYMPSAKAYVLELEERVKGDPL